MERYSLEKMGFNDRYSLNEKLHVNFFIANRMLERSIEALDTLPPGQVRTLAAINYLEEPTQQKVLEIMNIRAASLSEMLSKLEKRGYLIRTKDSKDKRIVNLKLTEKGMEIAITGRENETKIADKAFNALTEEEKMQLKNILEKLIHNWHEE